MFATLYKPISEASPTWAETKITDIFKIISYNYTKKFYEVGSFSMVIPVNEPSAELLETNTFLATDDGDFLFVTSIKETESRITLEGFDLKYLLAGRVTLFPTEEQDRGTYGYYVTKGSTGECICDIVRHNITEASDPNRRIYGFSVSSSAQGLTEDTYMTRLEPLDQVVATLCKNAGIGYDVTMEFGSSLGDGIRFEVIKPTDRSEEQTDVPRVIFAKGFMNVESLSREVGVTAEKNAIYAINGTNIDDAVVKLVNRDGEDNADSGVYRRETTVNVNCDVDEIDSYALKEAEDFISTDSFVMEAAAAESYKKEWFVGDIVTFRHKNIARHVPIIAVEVQRTADKCAVKLSAGEKPLKTISGISRTAEKAADEIKQKKFDDGNVLTVKELPAEGIKNKIYVLDEENGEAAPLADNAQTEETKIIDGYIFVDGKWRKFGGGDDTEGVGEFTKGGFTVDSEKMYAKIRENSSLYLVLKGNESFSDKSFLKKYWKTLNGMSNALDRIQHYKGDEGFKNAVANGLAIFDNLPLDFSAEELKGFTYLGEPITQVHLTCPGIGSGTVNTLFANSNIGYDYQGFDKSNEKPAFNGNRRSAYKTFPCAGVSLACKSALCMNDDYTPTSGYAYRQVYEHVAKFYPLVRFLTNETAAEYPSSGYFKTEWWYQIINENGRKALKLRNKFTDTKLNKVIIEWEWFYCDDETDFLNIIECLPVAELEDRRYSTTIPASECLISPVVGVELGNELLTKSSYEFVNTYGSPMAQISCARFKGWRISETDYLKTIKEKEYGFLSLNVRVSNSKYPMPFNLEVAQTQPILLDNKFYCKDADHPAFSYDLEEKNFKAKCTFNGGENHSYPGLYSGVASPNVLWRNAIFSSNESNILGKIGITYGDLKNVTIKGSSEIDSTTYLSEQINQMKSEIEALKSEIAQLKGAAS